MWKLLNLCICAIVLTSTLGMPANMSNTEGDEMKSYIIVIKDDSVMAAEELKPSCEMFLEGAKNLGLSKRRGIMPKVTNYTNIGIGFAAEMNEVALKMVREIDSSVCFVQHVRMFYIIIELLH